MRCALAIVAALAAMAHVAPARAAEDCAPGYKNLGGSCALQVPADTVPVPGGGWACKPGYYGDGGMCLRVTAPANAHLSTYGHSWACDPGFYEADRACRSGQPPPRSYATAGKGLVCNLGYEESEGSCVPSPIPRHARRVGDSGLWQCNAGFQDIGDRCVPLEIPRNARLGSGRDAWVCDYGYHPFQNTCVVIDVPNNASLGFYGDVWSCNRGYYEIRGVCLPDDKAHRALVASTADVLPAETHDATPFVPLRAGRVPGSGRTFAMVAAIGFVLGAVFIYLIREPRVRHAGAQNYKMTYVPRPRGSGLSLTWRPFGNRVDALTGAPIVPAADVAQCRNCRAWYHADSVQALRRENESKCVACGRAAVGLVSPRTEWQAPGALNT